MTEHYNVLVVGGGIHGVGVAQAAACAGYTVLLLEKTRLAAGTSSRSSKLIHGGLRYLEGHDYALVRESLAERALLLKLAPGLVRLQPFHIPVYSYTSRRPLTIRAGLSLYALLGGLHRENRFRKLRRRRLPLRLVVRPRIDDTADALLCQQLQVGFEQLPGGVDLGCQFEHPHL